MSNVKADVLRKHGNFKPALQRGYTLNAQQEHTVLLCR